MPALAQVLGFGCRHSSALLKVGCMARQAAIQTSEQRPNKALHPTAYSPLVPRSLSAAGELSRCAAAPTWIHGIKVLWPLILGCVRCEYSRRGFCSRGFPALARCFGFVAAWRFGSFAAFGFRRLILFGSSQSTLAARQAAGEMSQQQYNKALHPTAYSFARSSLRFRRRVSLIVSLRARGFSANSSALG